MREYDHGKKPSANDLKQVTEAPYPSRGPLLVFKL
jgi:hypothetical protein